MMCRKLNMLPLECIVRGYITGSGWKSYKENGTVCGIKLPEGLKESDKLPEPIFTPSTKLRSVITMKISPMSRALTIWRNTSREREKNTLPNCVTTPSLFTRNVLTTL